MGLLDDAIREHLELRRLRGADPTEISRLEREALGPVRNRGDDTEDADEGSGPAAEGEPVDSEAARPSSEDAPAFVPAIGEGEVEQPTEYLVPPVTQPHPSEHPVDSTQSLEHPRPDEQRDPPEDSHRDVSSPPPAGEPTVGYDVDTGREREPAPPPPHPSAPEGEDVLEETPDFLQETPEHDRLWFEQRPPRDFDFDK